MPFVIPSVLRNTFSSRNNKCRDASGMRPAPELVVLDVAEGVKPSPKPPVRIFLGTEPAHYRAERIFVWSIERVRDPARVYEIFLMKELAGFDRRRWLTGFTNYRFAIPHFAQGIGRAIWNDVDQAYLADPAELFDTDMGECGLLTVPPLSSSALLDTAVMLIDCERMASVWTGDEAMHGRKNNLLAKVQAIPGLRGDLPGEWNARDEEYVPGRSKLLHWTILHTQPWHPLPDAFVYQHNPVGHVWYDMERSANLAGYHVFTADKPSAQFRSLLTQIRASANGGETKQQPAARPSAFAPTTRAESLDKLIEKTGPKTLLEYRFAGDAIQHLMRYEPLTEQEGITVTRFDPACQSGDARPATGFDGVVCTDALDFIPDEDIPWVIDDLFDWAKQFVYVTVECSPRGRTLADGTVLCGRQRDPAWWKAAFESAAERHPRIQWKLVFNQPANAGAETLREIGWCGDQPPRVWVLNDGIPVDTSQSTALAEALGWPFEIVDSPFNTRRERPDLVIAANRHTGSWAQRICRESGGRTRSVRIDGKGGAVAKDFDAVISPGYFHLPPHPHRIESVTQLTRITPERLARARDRCPRLFGLAAHPRIVVLLGASESSGPQDTVTSRKLGEEIRTFASITGGSVFALISRRITPGLAGALVAGLGESPHVHTWSPNHRDDDTYLAYLELADTIIVTGDDEFLMADAAASGKTVYVYPLSERPPKLSSRFRETVFARSQARPLNKRGTVRPQQGLEYFCARLIERGIVLPPHDLNAMHQSLVRRGVIHQFGAPTMATNPHSGLRVAQDAARQVRQLLDLGEHIRFPHDDPGHASDWNRYAAARS